MDKLFLQVPELQPRLRKIHKRLKDDIDDLQPIDDIRQTYWMNLLKQKRKILRSRHSCLD